LNQSALLKEVNTKLALQIMNAKTVYIAGMHLQAIEDLIKLNVLHYIVNLMVQFLAGLLLT